MFYEDLRKLKDKFYNLIKSELFDSLKINGDLYTRIGNKYEISVYDMRNKDFFMLVRAEMDIEIRIDGEETVIQLYQMIILMFLAMAL